MVLCRGGGVGDRGLTYVLTDWSVSGRRAAVRLACAGRCRGACAIRLQQKREPQRDSGGGGRRGEQIRGQVSDAGRGTEGQREETLALALAGRRKTACIRVVATAIYLVLPDSAPRSQPPRPARKTATLLQPLSPAGELPYLALSESPAAPSSAAPAARDQNSRCTTSRAAAFCENTSQRAIFETRTLAAHQASSRVRADRPRSSSRPRNLDLPRTPVSRCQRLICTQDLLMCAAASTAACAAGACQQKGFESRLVRARKRSKDDGDDLLVAPALVPYRNGLEIGQTRREVRARDSHALRCWRAISCCAQRLRLRRNAPKEDVHQSRLVCAGKRKLMYLPEARHVVGRPHLDVGSPEVYLAAREC